jgi:hypothetical protein
MGKAGADAGANQQGTCQSGTRGISYRIEFGQCCLRLRQYLAGQRQHPADVVAGRQFRNHAAVLCVQGDLGMQGMGQQAAVRVIERNAGFVAGGFDAEYEHGISLKMRKKTGKWYSKRQKLAENGKNQQLVDWGVV